MTEITAPPIYQPMVGDIQDLVASLPWILFFNSLYTGDTGTSWTPAFANLTEVGTPTITGRGYRLSRSLVYFSIKIVPGTSTTATAGSTYVSNFPYTMTGDGACIAVSGLLGSTPGMCDSASNHIYVPAWSAITVPLTVVGIVEAS